MKTFAWHVLILGGFYFIVSLLSSFPKVLGQMLQALRY